MISRKLEEDIPISEMSPAVINLLKIITARISRTAFQPDTGIDLPAIYSCK